MPETTHSFNTGQGRYDVIKYSNGQEHLYSVSGDNGHKHVGHESVMQGHTVQEREEHLKKHSAENEQFLKLVDEGKLIHEKGRYEGRLTREGREFVDYSNELAREAGEKALDGAQDNAETKQQMRLGPALWHSRKAGKRNQPDIKVNILGPSKKYPDGINPRGGVLYVEIETEDGSHYDHVRADRLEPMGEGPMAVEAAQSRVAGRQADKEAEQAVNRLDKIIPPNQKEERSEKTIEERFDDLQKHNDEAFGKISRAFALLAAGKNQEAADLLSEIQTEVKQSKHEKKSGEKNRDLGNKVGEANRAEIRGQNSKGEPFIYRRNEKGEWEVSRNGDLAKTWFPATPEMMSQDLGFELASANKPEGNDYQMVDIEAMKASRARIGEIDKEMSDRENPPTPERMSELKKEFDEEWAKLMGAMTGNKSEAKEEDEPKLDTEAMNDSQAKINRILDELKTNPSAERRAQLINELNEEQAKVAGLLAASEEVSETAATPEQSTQVTDQRRRSRWQRARDILSGRALLAWVNSRGDSGGEEGEVLGVPAGVAVVEGTASTVDRKERRERDRRGLAAFALGAVALGAGVVLDHYLLKNGQTPVFIKHFCQGGHSGYGHNHLPITPKIPEHSHINLSGINSDTIQAHTPHQFQEGVLHLLNRQGIHAHHVTPERLAHMNRWMESNHEIASGMREGTHGLEQNVTNFPAPGHEFVNTNASAQEGFVIGPGGSGREALDQWVREAERNGIVFTRG